MRRFVVFCGTFFYIGKIPGPGGTYGSLAVYVPALVLSLMGMQTAALTVLFGMLMVIAFIGSVFVGQRAIEVFGEPDPNCVVIDEVAGASLTLLFFPYAEQYAWQAVLLTFLSFRFFDIVKPFAIRRLERLGKGFGIVVDDMGAGLATLLLVQASRFCLQ